MFKAWFLVILSTERLKMKVERGVTGRFMEAFLTSNRFGVGNKAYYLDGKDDYVDLGILGGKDFEDQIGISVFSSQRIKWEQNEVWL